MGQGRHYSCWIPHGPELSVSYFHWLLHVRPLPLNTRFYSTIHGRSRYPGLHIWGRNTGKRIAVKVPPGRYLLVQAGKQLEVSFTPPLPVVLLSDCLIPALDWWPRQSRIS